MKSFNQWKLIYEPRFDCRDVARPSATLKTNFSYEFFIFHSWNLCFDPFRILINFSSAFRFSCCISKAPLTLNSDQYVCFHVTMNFRPDSAIWHEAKSLYEREWLKGSKLPWRVYTDEQIRSGSSYKGRWLAGLQQGLRLSSNKATEC